MSHRAFELDSLYSRTYHFEFATVLQLILAFRRCCGTTSLICGVPILVGVGVAVGVFVDVSAGVGVGQYGSRRLLRSLVAMVLRPYGMHPVNLLDPPLSSRVFRCFSFSRSAGMDPDSLFCPRVRVCRFVMSPS